jgi:hypothetical protein
VRWNLEEMLEVVHRDMEVVAETVEMPHIVLVTC